MSSSACGILEATARKPGGRVIQDPPVMQLLVLQICFMVVLCCMVFSLGFCCCRISAESKAFQLQRQVDTIKSEKLRVENGMCVLGGGGVHVSGASSLFFLSRTRRTETSD